MSDPSTNKCQYLKPSAFQRFKEDFGFTWGFRLSVLKKQPELIPLVAIIGTACVGACGTVLYFLATKTDVSLQRCSKRGPPRYMYVKPTQCTKFYCSNPNAYQPDETMEALKEELGWDLTKKRC